jgi:hypothetical protein
VAKRPRQADPELPPFFVDACLGSRYLREALLGAEWLPLVAERQWLVLTKDHNIRFDEVEAQYLRVPGARTVFFSCANSSGPEQATACLSALPRLRRILATRTAPLVMRMSRLGDITHVSGERRGGRKKDE